MSLPELVALTELAAPSELAAPTSNAREVRSEWEAPIALAALSGWAVRFDAVEQTEQVAQISVGLRDLLEARLGGGLKTWAVRVGWWAALVRQSLAWALLYGWSDGSDDE